MTRKLILSIVIATATLSDSVVAVSRADASPPAVLPHHRFEVLAQRDSAAWESHGTFRLRAHAEVLAVRLRHQGYRVEIRQF